LFVPIAALSILLAPNAPAVVFNDGGVHVIDAGNSYPLETMELMDGPGGVGTTVNVVDGGALGTLACGPSSVRGESVLVVFGGDIGCSSNSGVDLWDSASLVMTGGRQLGYTLARDDSSVDILGGELASLAAYGNSMARVFGGTLKSFHHRTPHASEVTGGQIRTVISGGGTLNIRAGSIGYPDSAGLYCTGNIWCSVGAQAGRHQAFARVNIWGGDVTGRIQSSTDGSTTGTGEIHVYGGAFTNVELRAVDESYIELTGGDFVNSTLLAFDESLVVIYGSGFNYPMGPIPNTTGTLTGTLDDGTPITLPFARASTATIELPEPSALTALGSGVAILALLYRRKAMHGS